MMQFTDIEDDGEHASHTAADRSAAAARSTWVSVAVSLVLSAVHIAVDARQRVLQRYRVLSLMTHIDPWKRPDLDHAADLKL